MFLQVGNNGGFEALIIDACGRVLNKDYAKRVAAHEAGHFLVAYLTGLLPKKYILSSVDAYRRSDMHRSSYLCSRLYPELSAVHCFHVTIALYINAPLMFKVSGK